MLQQINTLTMAQCTTRHTEQTAIRSRINKWTTTSYSLESVKFPIFEDALFQQFEAANCYDVMLGLDIRLPDPEPLPAGNVLALLRARQNLYDLTNTCGMVLLKRTFADNPNGHNDIQPCERNDGATAWANIVALQRRPHIREHGSLRTQLLRHIQGEMSFSEFCTSIRLKRIGCRAQPDQDVTDDDCRDVLRNGFIDTTHDGRITELVNATYHGHTFEELVSFIRNRFEDYEKWCLKYNPTGQLSAVRAIEDQGWNPPVVNALADPQQYCTKPQCKDRKRHRSETCWEDHPEKAPRWFKAMQEKKRKREGGDAGGQPAKQNQRNQQLQNEVNKAIINMINSGQLAIPGSYAMHHAPPPNSAMSQSPLPQLPVHAPVTSQQKTLTWAQQLAQNMPSMHSSSSASSSSSSSGDMGCMMIAEDVVNAIGDKFPVKPQALLVALDTGTSCHVTPERNAFHMIEQTQHSIRTADGQPHQASGCGLVSYFKRVYYYPQMKLSLWSPGRMIEDGWTMQFINGMDIIAAHPLLPNVLLTFFFETDSKLWLGYLPLQLDGGGHP